MAQAPLVARGNLRQSGKSFAALEPPRLVEIRYLPDSTKSKNEVKGPTAGSIRTIEPEQVSVAL